MTKLKIVIKKSAVQHFDKHNVSKEEVLQIVKNPTYLKRLSKNRYSLYGQTNTGRYLTVILEKKKQIFEVVTARDTTSSEKSLYRKKAK
jgi:uncharacterized DUF497 family protein